MRADARMRSVSACSLLSCEEWAASGKEAPLWLISVSSAPSCARVVVLTAVTPVSSDWEDVEGMPRLDGRSRWVSTPLRDPRGGGGVNERAKGVGCMEQKRQAVGALLGAALATSRLDRPLSAAMTWRLAASLRSASRRLR